ncbi:FG-GAP repeat domain-containing protein [Streptomyces smyrnaeus]|uniref:FG-GAP repeat domain-containing protein n=1 Tax=Streptomyces smyrnaeus TaxID=1387713 RepID=UPI00160E2AE9
MFEGAERHGDRRRPRRRARTAAAAAAVVSASCALVLVLTGCGASDTSSDGRSDSSGERPPAGKADDSEDGPDSGDFNGDGYDDYATVVHSASKDQKRTKDTLLVVYGSKKGLNRSWTTRAGGRFQLLLRTDLNGDGFTDLVTSRAGRAGTEAQARASAMFGGPRGLTGPRSLQVPKGFSPKASGDFDGDGKTDLFDTGSGGPGAPDSDPSAREGGPSARIVYGPVASAGEQRSRKHRREPAPLDLSQHGYAAPDGAAAGDFDADGRTDLVLTYGYDAEQDDSAPADLTPVAYYRGTKRGLARDRSLDESLRQALAGGQDGPRAPSVGDADGDGIDDLLMPLTVPVSYAEEKAGKGGGVGVLYGARSGLGTGTGKRTLRITQGRHASFGASPSVGNVNGDDHPDIVANTPDFRRHDGLVTLLPGGPDGPSAQSAQEIDARTKGLPGTPNPHRWNAFHVQPPLLDTNGDGHEDALVFVPLYNHRKGAFLEIPGSDKGFAPTRSRQLTPSDLGVPLRLR